MASRSPARKSITDFSFQFSALPSDYFHHSTAASPGSSPFVCRNRWTCWPDSEAPFRSPCRFHHSKMPFVAILTSLAEDLPYVAGSTSPEFESYIQSLGEWRLESNRNSYLDIPPWIIDPDSLRPFHTSDCNLYIPRRLTLSLRRR